MPQPAAMPTLPSARPVEVLPPAALRVLLGVCAGDPLGGLEEARAGDIFRLDPGLPPLRLHLTAPAADGLRRIGPGSDIGMAGDAVAPVARHLFRDEDGTQAEVLVLAHLPRDRAHPPARFLLPLQPLAPGKDLHLIRSDLPAGPGCLPDLAPGAIWHDCRILLACGTPRPAASLRPGDALLTRDHGAQPLRLAGRMRMRATGALAPVAIPRGTLGNGAELLVGQDCRLFRYRPGPLTGPDGAGTLVAARHLLGLPGVHLLTGGFADYVVLVLDRHEVVYAEGVPVESLRVDAATTERLPADLAATIRLRLPDLFHHPHFGARAAPDIPVAGAAATA